MTTEAPARSIGAMPDAPPRPRGLARLADLCFRRRRAVVLVWIAALAVVAGGGGSLAGEFAADYATPGSESEAAAERLDRGFPGGGRGDAIDVVWTAPDVRDAQVRRELDGFLRGAEDLEGIASAGEPQVAPGGRVALARLELDRAAWDVPIATGRALIDRARALDVRVELGGGPIGDAQEGASPEVAGLAAALVILVVAFGSVVAAGLPILVALFGLGLSSSLVGIAAGVVDVPEWAPAVSSLLGIGVGIDYALLILTRFRSALDEGREPREAVTEAVATAGRSVLVAGVIVVVSVLGLVVMGVSYMTGVAVAASLSVLVVLAAALTLLPAVLGIAGRRVDRLRIPGLARAADRDERAARWSRAVQRRPVVATVLAILALAALTVPVAGLHIAFPDAGNDREGTTTRAAYDLVAEGFGPGANGPLLVVGDASLAREAGRLAQVEGVASVGPPQVNPAGDTAMVTVIPQTAPQAVATEETVRGLREATDAQVGGLTASVIDQSEYVAGRLPLFVGAVVAVAFVLLLLAFRAPLIALKAAVMNLLSVGAAYGVVALFAEGGALGRLAGIDTDTPVPPFIPVIMFAILFGLSMDYEVFLLSRVREEFLRRGETGSAVTAGLAKTARVITAAAAIMVAVFLAFVFSPEVFLKLMGIGMAAAILVDATLVRMVLVPAVMQLLGKANWWAPRWLERPLGRGAVSPRASG